MLHGITGVIVDDDDKAVAIITVHIYHKGVAGIFIVPDKKAHAEKKKTFISSILFMRGILDEIVRKHNLRRVETLTIDDKKHNRWMEYLGFLADGTKRSYGLNGEDYIMWSKLWV